MLTWVAVLPSDAGAQVPGSGFYGGDGSFFGAAAGGLHTPRIPPQGAWAEVIAVTDRWIVVQNERGQQFPISPTTINQFVIRWPTSLDRVSPTALVEATGVDLGSNRIRTDHLDVFEGVARNLVTPTHQILIGFNRPLTIFDIEQMQTYGVVFPLHPIEYRIPQRLNIVGPVAGFDPLRIVTPGNNFVTILPNSLNFTITQVTLGNHSLLERGDLVYFVPLAPTPKSLALSQLVAYKKVPLNRPGP